MQCIKTGVVAYLKEYDCKVRGDAFVLHGSGNVADYRSNETMAGEHTLLIRANYRCYPGEENFEHLVRNIDVKFVEMWFDDHKLQTGGGVVSTLIVAEGDWEWFANVPEVMDPNRDPNTL